MCAHISEARFQKSDCRLSSVAKTTGQGTAVTGRTDCGKVFTHSKRGTGRHESDQNCLASYFSLDNKAFEMTPPYCCNWFWAVC